MGKLTFIITCPFGMESLCKNELGIYNIKNVKVSNGLLHLQYTAEFLNIAKYLKIPNRIYHIIHNQNIFQYDDIYSIFKKIEITKYFNEKIDILNFDIDIIFQNTEFQSKKTIQSIVSRALFEKFSNEKNVIKDKNRYATINYKEREKNYNRQTFEKRYRIGVFINGNNIEIGIDCFGNSLHKRGYRIAGGISPIKENLASALIINSLKMNHEILLDPFCGSSTIITEAILFLFLRPNPFLNSDIRFSKEIDFSNDSDNLIYPNFSNLKYNCRYFIGSDIDEKAIDNSRKNIEKMLKIYFNNSFLFKKIEEMIFQYEVKWQNNKFYIYILKSDAFSIKQVLEKHRIISEKALEKMIIVSNLPYGKRLDKQNVKSNSIAAIQKVFKDFNCNIHFLTSMKYLPDIVQKKPDKKRKLYNGKIEVNLFSYELI